MSRDSLYAEREELRKEMAGISPKTETWKKLNERLASIGAQLGGQKITSGILDSVRVIKERSMLKGEDGRRRYRASSANLSTKKPEIIEGLRDMDWDTPLEKAVKKFTERI